MKMWLATVLALSLISAGSTGALAKPKRGPVIVITQNDLLHARMASELSTQRPSVMVITQADLLQSRTASLLTPRYPSVMVITEKDLPRDEDYLSLPTLDAVMRQAPPPVSPPGQRLKTQATPMKVQATQTRSALTSRRYATLRRSRPLRKLTPVQRLAIQRIHPQIRPISLDHR